MWIQEEQKMADKETEQIKKLNQTVHSKDTRERDQAYNEYVKQVTANTVTVAPYIRWSYYQNDAVRLFLDGTAAIGFVKIKDGDTTKAGQIGLRPGIAVKLNDHFSFVAKYGFLGYRRNVNTSGDSFGLMLTSEDLSIGFHYNF